MTHIIWLIIFCTTYLISWIISCSSTSDFINFSGFFANLILNSWFFLSRFSNKDKIFRAFVSSSSSASPAWNFYFMVLSHKFWLTWISAFARSSCLRSSSSSSVNLTPSSWTRSIYAGSAWNWIKNTQWEGSPMWT